MSKVMMVVFAVLTAYYFVMDYFTAMVMCGLFAWLCEGVNHDV